MSELTHLGQDVYHVQNPALASLVQWRFVVGYTKARADASGVPLQFLFLVAPMVLDDQIRQVIRGTQRRSGLRQFVDKFSARDGPGSDVLVSIHDRVAHFMCLSIRGIQIGVQSGIMAVDADSGHAVALSQTRPRTEAESVREFVNTAEKLGEWMSTMSLFEVSRTLRVRF